MWSWQAEQRTVLCLVLINTPDDYIISINIWVKACYQNSFICLLSFRGTQL